MISTSDPLPSVYSCRSIPRLAFPRIWHSKVTRRCVDQSARSTVEYCMGYKSLQHFLAICSYMFLLHVPTACPAWPFFFFISMDFCTLRSLLTSSCTSAGLRGAKLQLLVTLQILQILQEFPGRIGNCNTGLLTTSSLQGLAVSKFLPKLQKSTPNTWRSKHGS